MRVAVYYPWIYLTSGAERSILEFARRSRHEVTIFTNHFSPEQTYKGFGEEKVVELARVSVNRSFSNVLSAALKIAVQKIDLSAFDALLVVCEGIGDMVVFRNNGLPAYCLCLTPLRPVFDPFYRAVYLDGKGLVSRLKLSFFARAYSLVDRLAWRRYNRVLCISRECFNRVLAGRLAPEEKLGFAFPGIDYRRFRPTGVRERYFLIAGRIMWTKNIELGIEAFARLRRREPGFSDFGLKIAGIVDKKSEGYFEQLKGLAGEGNGIEFVVHPSDEKLFDLYDRSYAVLYTPFNEDWGMVPLEAMAYGKPVIAVARGGPLETVQHGRNGFLAEPDPEDFCNYMVRLASSPQEAREMGERGRKDVSRYDWSYFVEALDGMLDRG